MLKSLAVNPAGVPRPCERPISPSVAAMARQVIRMRPSKYISIWKLFESVPPYCGTLCQVTATRSPSCFQVTCPVLGIKSSNSAAIRGTLKCEESDSPYVDSPPPRVM